MEIKLLVNLSKLFWSILNSKSLLFFGLFLMFGVFGYAQPIVSVTTTESSPTNATSFGITITFSEPVDSFVEADIIVTNGVTSNFIGSDGDSIYTVDISPIADGTVTVDIPAGVAVATTGGLPNLLLIPSFTLVYDATPPGILISAPSADPTSGGPVSYTVTYSGESSISLSDDDIVLNPTGTAAASSASVSGSAGSTRTVTIGGITGDGTLGISLAAGTASDDAGNTASAAGPSATFLVDNTAPSGYTVLINQDPINGGNETAVSFTFTAAEIGATYNYSFSSTGGGIPVTGSGTVAGPGQTISGINLSGLGDG
ncbi:Ig-like domain-containing protein, partial [Muriicola sp. E247]|uniref:Ig-like domain-containing protein n=1 Tax=Muriicola sp. E247 TaxID=3242730 RepID=UPI00352327FC